MENKPWGTKVKDFITTARVNKPFGTQLKALFIILKGGDKQSNEGASKQ